MHLALGSRLSRRAGGGGGGGAEGTALAANEIERTTGVSTYSPTMSFTRPITWADGDIGVVERSQDATFATGVSTKTNALTAAVTTYDFDLDTIASGVWYWRMAAYRGPGTQPASLNWSNIAGVGDAVAPTITSSAAPGGYQFIAGTLALTADKAVTWEIVGGFDQAQFSISGSTLSWASQTATGNYVVQIQATSYFNVPSSIQTITLAVAVNTADAFTFTDVTNATLSTQYTSNTITLNIPSGSSLPITVTGGTYSINGGAYTSSAGTVVDADQIAVRQTSSASNNTTTDVVLTVGSTSDTYSVTTPVVLSTDTTWNPSDKSASVALTNSNRTAEGTAAYSFTGARGTTTKTTLKRYFEGTVTLAPASSVTGIGVANATAALGSEIGGDVNGCIYFAAGVLRHSGSSVQAPPACSNGDVMMIAIDIPNLLIWVGKNGTWHSGNPSAGTGGYSLAGIGTTLYCAFCDQYNGGMIINTGQTAFAHSAPTGFVAWDL